jgi:hypothetical protein
MASADNGVVLGLAIKQVLRRGDGQLADVIGEKCSPGLRRRVPRVGKISRDRTFRERDTELQQFARDAWRTPQPVLHG